MSVLSVMSGATSDAGEISMHAVKIRRDGEVVGVQLRRGSGGPGNSIYFAAKKHGGAEAAEKAAKAAAKRMGAVVSSGRGGSPVGRKLRTNKTGVPGIGFQWAQYSSPVLYVTATWVSHKVRGQRGNKGRPCQARYSVEKHGLEGALDKAIEARMRGGAQPPDKKLLMRALRAEYRRGGE